jgi:hypothetical protein
MKGPGSTGLGPKTSTYDCRRLPSVFRASKTKASDSGCPQMDPSFAYLMFMTGQKLESTGMCEYVAAEYCNVQKNVRRQGLIR